MITGGGSGSTFTTGTVHVVLPGDIDDVTNPSGGNVYDRRVCQGLAALGWSVREIAVEGTWPRPDEASCAELTRSLAELPDGAVVLLDGLVACGVPEVLLPQADRLRLVVLVHMPLADETGLPAATAADLDARERTVLHAASAVVATSPWAARRLAEHHGLASGRVHVVTPGTDPAALARGTDGVSQLLCVAAVTPHKGHDLLVEALATLAELPWSCLCVGPVHRDSGYADGLRRRIADRGLDDRVQLVGPRTGEALATAYSAADLLVLPSRGETYGMVLTEALARGIPVLATAANGVPETVGRVRDGEVPGILVPPGDPATLSGGLRRWFGEHELRSRLRSSARQRRGGLSSWEESSRRLASALAPLT